MNPPIYIIDGARTPFLKARNAPGPFAAGDLATAVILFLVFLAIGVRW